ncbi:MAG: tyrosine-type recombinase/integrase [candidate division Zixibacteria bacterium]|nr:tyrosine-type recombinase/integrase [candidate division Zixibacteria bacterium]
MGSIFKRGRIWYIDITVEGKRLRKPVGTSKKVASLALADLEVKVARQQFDLDVPDGQLADLFEAYLGYSDTNNAPSTTLRYRQVIQNFVLFLRLHHSHISKVSELSLPTIEGYKRFRKSINPRTIELPDDFEYKVARNTKLASPKTINYELKTLKSIFRWGKKHGFCHTNPCEDVTLFKIQDAKTPRFLSRNECSQLLDYSSPKYYPVFYTFLNTGLRLGELINLQWGDINLKRRILTVRKKEDWKPKTGEREIPLNDGMIGLLRRMKPPRATLRDYIFTHEDGRKMGPKVRKALISTAVEADIPDLTKVHSLRHTFASQLVMSGIDLPTVQRLLGHSDIQTTMIYAHLAPEHLLDAVQKLEIS